MIKCSLDCLNFDEETCSCLYGIKLFRIKGTDEYGIKGDCKYFESIDDILNEDTENKEPEYENDEIDEIDDSSDSIEEVEESEDILEEENETPEARYDVSDNYKNSDKEFEEFEKTLFEGHSLFDIVKDSLREENNMKQEKPEVNDEVDKYLMDETYDETPEDAVRTANMNVQKNMNTQRNIPNRTTQNVVDEDEFNSVDDFVTTTEIIDGYSTDIEEAKKTLGTERNMNVQTQQKPEIHSAGNNRGKTNISEELRQFEEDVKSGKINPKEYNKMFEQESTTKVQISEEEKRAAEEQIRKQLGM